ncbi:hypothetical protein [Candidatus Roseilinea sp. NK_OTU-006]|jgi:hypothetical protein|uniref:hypothetical protein n=1 Tax=Candidatus Roseilinea sp. NK_OTU-006 TaxID=2704250 RepID=UPI00145DF828|nr:hypothetical protein [Candidatus Roseilinea sp. NK_OTU-006]
MNLPTPFVQSDLPISPRYAGKVHDGYDWPGGQRAPVAADRISAFDRILGTIPATKKRPGSTNGPHSGSSARTASYR